MRANRRRSRTKGTSIRRLCVDRVCPQCGKTFPFHDYDTWAYKQVIHGRTNFYCSWSCLQAARASTAVVRVVAPRSDPEKDLAIYQLRESGLTYQAIADRLGCSDSMVYRACQRVKDRMAAEAEQREVSVV